jgi:hypothetical protein
MKLFRMAALGAGLSLALSACSNPYDPTQRALGGGAMGAGAGALLGGIAGGGRGALTGALIGGAIGAAGGAATTPSAPTQQPVYAPHPPQSYQSGPYRY